MKTADQLKVEVVEKIKGLNSKQLKLVANFTLEIIKESSYENYNSLSQEEQNILDERWAKCEQGGLEGLTLDELNILISKKHNI
jgi:hypothetical protein